MTKQTPLQTQPRSGRHGRWPSIVRARVPASELPPQARNDTDPTRWSLTIQFAGGTINIPLDDPLKGAVLPLQKNSNPDSVDFVYFQAVMEASVMPQTLNLSYAQVAWSKSLTVRPSNELDLPFALMRTQEGPSYSPCSVGDLAQSLLKTQAFRLVRQTCGIYLHSTVERCVQHPKPSEIAFSVECDHKPLLELVRSRGVSAELKTNFEPDVYCHFPTPEGSRSIEDVLRLFGTEDQRLRLVMGPYFARIAHGSLLYENKGIQRESRSVWVYGGDRSDIVGTSGSGVPADPAKLRPELLVDRSNDCGLSFATVGWTEDSDLEKQANRAVHEFGHMFGLAHPEDTATRLDDCYGNMMSPSSSNDPDCPDRGVHLTQAQCLLMALDIRGYSRGTVN